MNRIDTTNAIQRSVLGAIAAATLLGLGGIIGDEVSDDE
jgi:hypothetical protein